MERGDAEHAVITIKTAVGHQDVAVWIESEKITEGLDSDDGTGDGIVFRDRILEKNFQGFPCATAQIGKKLPILFLTDNITCDIIRTMSKADKLLERMRNNPQGWRIEDVKTVARRFKMLMRAKGGSHHVFGFPLIDEAVSIPAHKPIKAVYIIRFLELIDKIKEV